jgi:hypothetical protein
MHSLNVLSSSGASASDLVRHYLLRTSLTPHHAARVGPWLSSSMEEEQWAATARHDPSVKASLKSRMPRWLGYQVQNLTHSTAGVGVEDGGCGTMQGKLISQNMAERQACAQSIVITVTQIRPTELLSSKSRDAR